VDREDLFAERPIALRTNGLHRQVAVWRRRRNHAGLAVFFRALLAGQGEEYKEKGLLSHANRIDARHDEGEFSVRRAERRVMPRLHDVDRDRREDQSLLGILAAGSAGDLRV
jgi:hypothetical protein